MVAPQLWSQQKSENTIQFSLDQASEKLTISATRFRPTRDVNKREVA